MERGGALQAHAHPWPSPGQLQRHSSCKHQLEPQSTSQLRRRSGLRRLATCTACTSCAWPTARARRRCRSRCSRSEAAATNLCLSTSDEESAVKCMNLSLFLCQRFTGPCHNFGLGFRSLLVLLARATEYVHSSSRYIVTSCNPKQSLSSEASLTSTSAGISKLGDLQQNRLSHRSLWHASQRRCALAACRARIPRSSRAWSENGRRKPRGRRSSWRCPGCKQKRSFERRPCKSSWDEGFLCACHEPISPP